MARIILFGHGGWRPQSRTRTPYTIVPPGSSIRFYTENAKLLTLGFGLQVIQNNPGLPLPDSEWGAYRTVPNMTLYPAPEFHGHVQGALAHAPAGTRCLIANRATRLSHYFERYPGNDFIWIACRELQFRDQGGRAIGVNVVQR